MAFSRFRLQLLGRVLLLGGLLFATLWSLLRTGWDATPAVCGALLVAVLLELIRFLERGTRDFTSLMQAVAGGDFTGALPRLGRGAPFAEFEQASRTLIDVYRRLDLRRAASDELLQAVIEHVGAAVICFGSDGRIVFANQAARELLGAPASANLGSLVNVDPRLPGRLLALQDGERAQVELTLRGERATLLLHARRFLLLDSPYTTVVCQDIREPLESRDVEAWQTLTRVLTHEMMNSLTPIMTLSRLARDTLAAQRQAGAASFNEDVAESVDVIHERSSGLAEFIQAYRRFSHPPPPSPSRFAVRSLLDRVTHLMRPELEQQGIRLETAGDCADLQLHADPHQTEQILINLIRNAGQSLQQRADGVVDLRCERGEPGRVLVHVTDNGAGIPGDHLDRVFVPFFTTRSGGTGIGLSLSRQLAQLNGGSLGVSSVPGHCRFTLRLPAS